MIAEPVAHRPTLLDLPTNYYPVILADPPWSYKVYNGESGPVAKPGSRAGNRGIAEQHYGSLSIADLCALPVRRLTPKDAALFLWTTGPCLFEARAVMEAWGFKYRTVAFTWVKTEKSGKIVGRLGHYTRSSSEFCLLGVKGRMSRRDTGVGQVMISPLRQHSRKPDETYVRIERLFEGPYLELFARDLHAGWTVWGDQAPPQPQPPLL